MYIQEMNRPVFNLDDAHPAKKFLLAFIDCRVECVGRELDSDGEGSLDQRWRSKLDGKEWTFSKFAYSILSFDIELDGYLQNTPHLTTSELIDKEWLPQWRLLMEECADAARLNSNPEIVELTDQVLQMLDLWTEYLRYREESIVGQRGAD